MAEEGRLPVLLGEAPSKGGDRYHMFPLSGRPAQVLCNLTGIAPLEGESQYGRWTWALYERFECRNLFERYAQATPWSIVRARAAAVEAVTGLDGRVVVCLGRRVHAAVLDATLPEGMRVRPTYHSWYWPGDVAPPQVVVGIPHPSGLNRLLNDAEERVRSGGTLREALGRARS